MCLPSSIVACILAISIDQQMGMQGMEFKWMDMIGSYWIMEGQFRARSGQSNFWRTRSTLCMGLK